MTKDEAHAEAVELAHATGKPYAVWLSELFGYTVVRYQVGQESRREFIEAITPAQAQIEEEHDA